MDLNLQFRDALPPHTVCHLHSAGSGGSSRPQQLYQFAKADDCSDDTAARTVDRPTRTKVSNPLPIWRGTGSSESISLQQRVCCEPDFRGASIHGTR